MPRILRDLKWIYYVSRRFSRVDAGSRFSAAGFMPMLGIAFGVMALVVIMAVMNGFQSGSIDSILEISSYHIRMSADSDAVSSASAGHDSAFSGNETAARIRAVSGVKSVTPFYEAQGLLSGKYAAQCAAIIRAVPADISEIDSGFAREAKLYSGSFDLYSPENIVLGYELAKQLRVRVGDAVNIFALSGGADVDLFSDNRVFTVAGVFFCGYAEINSSYAFIPLETGKDLFGADSRLIYGIKLADAEKDAVFAADFGRLFPRMTIESWRSFNRSFFGALRVEKNILMLLVFLIFLMVGVNIFNGMRRMVYERKEEICVLTALGGSPSSVQGIFILRGLITGVCGALPGLIAGLLLSVRIDAVFTLFSSALYNAQLFFAMLFSPETAAGVRQNMLYLFYAKIPAHPFFGETLCIALFGIFASLAASWLASRKMLNLVIAEVLRDE
ncbi:MAG: ABC transporter permease [Bacteroides sp.]|nr:ABC transporter permease [Prevotella sp.]MCM1407396.1 ABC transporter permease [Treponema brennaborense]MCM1469886.1 ABC transporter permease [Bacteroides sp.]